MVDGEEVARWEGRPTRSPRRWTAPWPTAPGTSSGPCRTRRCSTSSPLSSATSDLPVRLHHVRADGRQGDRAVPAQSHGSGELAQTWQAADEIVFSRGPQVGAQDTRIARRFDPELVREIEAAASRDLDVSGAELAAAAWHAGAIDDCQVFVARCSGRQAPVPRRASSTPRDPPRSVASRAGWCPSTAPRRDDAARATPERRPPRWRRCARSSSPLSSSTTA